MTCERKIDEIFMKSGTDFNWGIKTVQRRMTLEACSVRSLMKLVGGQM